MKTVELTCDGCGADIAYTGNAVGYRLALNVERLPVRSNGDAVTMMGVYPPLEADCHFCGLACLDAWTDRRRHVSALWKRDREENPNQAVYLALSNHPDRATKRALFEADALAKFPKRQSS